MDDTESFHSFILGQNCPHLFKPKSLFESWGVSRFYPEQLKVTLTNKLKFRIGKRTQAVQWEGDCKFIYATIDQLLEWNDISNCGNAKDRSSVQQTFGACCKKHYWCYADYMYMKDVFSDDPTPLSSLKWSQLGFPGKDGNDSTIWFGTDGAHTVCHYDTYGYNVVLQIYGSKKWILFPPTDSECLYPTRIPYEESSVFSEVNLLSPDFTKHPRLKSSHPCVVELKAGDVLYVPPHWWHFVENLELSVSINLWYEAKNDDRNRLNEAIIRTIVGTCLPASLPDLKDNWINPTEDYDQVLSTENNISLLNASLQEVCCMEKACSPGTSETTVMQFVNVKSEFETISLRQISPKEIWKDAEGVCRKRKAEKINKKDKMIHNRQFTNKSFVQCLTHPDVVRVISKIALDKFMNNA